MRFTSFRFLLSAVALATAACEPMVDVHGNAPTPENLAEVHPGLTKADVTALLGSPASSSPFTDDQWYYISSRFESHIFLKPEEVSRQVIIVTFDRDKVSDVSVLRLRDGQDIAMNTRVTPTAGKDLGVLEQLIGNVGRFNTYKDKH